MASAMGQSTPTVLEASGVIVYRVNTVEDVCPTVKAAIQFAFQSRCRVAAVLLSQKLIGAKSFEGSAPLYLIFLSIPISQQFCNGILPL
jgi:hypothetical protein